MIVGKAPVLQKPALARPLGPIRRGLGAEATAPQGRGDGVKIRRGFERAGNEGIGDAHALQRLADAIGPLPRSARERTNSRA